MSKKLAKQPSLKVSQYKKIILIFFQEYSQKEARQRQRTFGKLKRVSPVQYRHRERVRLLQIKQQRKMANRRANGSSALQQKRQGG